MRLRPISGDLAFPWQALDAALAQRGVDNALWIVRNPLNHDFYVVCTEAADGELVRPVCQAFFGVFVETDRFTDPVFRINLGPGVWPVDEE